MAWEIKSDRPVYLQLMDYIKMQIISGAYKAGDKVPSVRELALEAEVNPNTMQKALTELEREKLLYTKRTVGRFITDDVERLKEIKLSVAQNEITRFLNTMNGFGFKIEEIYDLLRKVTEQNGESS